MYDLYEPEPPEMTDAEIERDYVGALIECADQAPPLAPLRSDDCYCEEDNQCDLCAAAYKSWLAVRRAA